MNNLLAAAINNERNEDFNFFLSGDLSQMSSQRSFLNARGIQTKQNNVYPCLRTCDVKQALTLIWKNKQEGWWHYKDDYIKHDVCSEEDFNNRLFNK